MDDIRSWWEVPCIAHYCHVFVKPFKLPEFDIEELEDALLLDCEDTPSSLLVQLFCNFLNGIVDRDITEDNWQFFLKLHIEWRCEFLKEKWNPFAPDKGYKHLTTRLKVEVLHRLIHWRLELDDVGDLVKGLDGPSLRVEPLGKDADGHTYWYFYGTRLYREEGKRRTRKKAEENGGTPATGRGRKKATNTPASGRGKGRGRGAGRGGRTPSTTPGRGRRKKQEEEEEGGRTPGRRGRGGRRGKEDGATKTSAKGRRKARKGASQSDSSSSEGENGGEDGEVEQRQEKEGGADGGEMPKEARQSPGPVEENAMATGDENGPRASDCGTSQEEEGGGGTQRTSRGRRDQKSKDEDEEEKMEVDGVQEGEDGDSGVEEDAEGEGGEGKSPSKRTRAAKEEGVRRTPLRAARRRAEEGGQSPAVEGRSPAVGRRGRRRKEVAENGPETEEVEEEENEEEEVKPVKVNGSKESSEAPSTGWSVACGTLEEWEGLVDLLSSVRHPQARRLYLALSEDHLPHVTWLFQSREKEERKRVLAEMPRRTSDRIAIRAVLKAEQERYEAMEREKDREEYRKRMAEEMRVREEEEAEKRQRRRDEAVRKRKAREEEQLRVRQEEEEVWTKALSGELSGPRKAALGAAENVTGVQIEEPWDLITADKDDDLYTAMFKILAGLRKHEDAWIFEDPVTEAIAPGYFDIINKPMDYSTVEKKLEAQQYKCMEEFTVDMELIYSNCHEYNGSESEYSEVSDETKKLFERLCKKHFSGEEVEEEEVGQNKKKKHRESRSPSACKTPELTSESSSEEDSDDSDESYGEGRKPKKPKATAKTFPEGDKPILPLPPNFSLPGGLPRGLPHPHMPPPHYYHQMMMQQRAQFGGARPPMPPPDMAFRHPYSRMPPPYPYPHYPGMRPHPQETGPPMYPPYPSYPPQHMYRHPYPPRMATPPHMGPSSYHTTPSPSHSPSPAVGQRPPGPAMADSPLKRQTSSPSMDGGSPRVAKEQGVAMEQGVAKETDSPALRRALSMGSLKEGEGGGDQKGQDGVEGAGKEGVAKDKEERRSGSMGEPSAEGGHRAMHAHPGMSPGYRNPYDAGREAAYRYHQVMAMHHRYPPDAYGSYPHPPIEHPPPYPPHTSHPMSREEAYYAWQQQAMLGRAHTHPSQPHPHPSQSHPSQPHPHPSQSHPSQPHPHPSQAYPSHPHPHPSQPHPSQPHPSQPHPSHPEMPYPPSEHEVARQRAWHAEMRRRQYYMMQHLQHQRQQQQREGKAPPTEAKETDGKTPEVFPDYQDSLRRYALGLSPDETRKGEGGPAGGKATETLDNREPSKAERGKEGGKDSEKKEGRKDSEKKEGRKDSERKERGKDIEGKEGGGDAEGKEREPAAGKKEDGSEEKKGEKGEQEERPAVEKDSVVPASTKSSSGSNTPSSKDSPTKSRSAHGRPPSMPYPYHMQNGYPSHPSFAGMHEHFPPGMVPPYTPPYHHPQSKGVPPGYPGYYGNRNPYYPHPYMQDPEQMERWKMEMKRQHAMSQGGPPYGMPPGAPHSPYPHPSQAYPYPHPHPSQLHPSHPHPSHSHPSHPHPSQSHPSHPHPSQSHPSHPHPSQAKLVDDHKRQRPNQGMPVADEPPNKKPKTS